MKRKIAVGALILFLAYTGSFIFVYLWRAFRVPEPPPGDAVIVWHGDPFIRALFVAVLFLIGLVVMVYLGLLREHRLRAGEIRIRQDLWEWVVEQSREAGEPPSRLAERAVASYKARLEGGRSD